jgi:L-lactate utilization protein LutC
MAAATNPTDVGSGTLVDIFESRAAALLSRVTVCRRENLIEALRTVIEDPAEDVRVSKDLRDLLPELSIVGTSTSKEPQCALTRGRLGIASTGSVALSEPSRGERSPMQLTEHHVIVLPEEAIVPTVADSASYLRESIRNDGRYITFATGPSRTADIERILTVGAHGPRRVDVVVVRNWVPGSD